MHMNEGDILQLIYEDRNGKLTQRFVRVFAVTDDVLIAYCYYRKAPRSFAWKNILSVHLERKHPA